MILTLMIETSFDPKHPYYDPKSSRENPKWDVVHVQYVRKFPKVIRLTDLRSFAKVGGTLEKMQLLKQSRLSVSAVEPKEWDFILSLVEEEYTEDEDNAEQVDDTPVQSVEKGVNRAKSKDLNAGDLVDDAAEEGDDEEVDDQEMVREEHGVEGINGDHNGDG